MHVTVRVAESYRKLFFREYGSGFPLLFLHGGWGYEIYPFDPQIQILGKRLRIIAPDRSGYGKSGRITKVPRGFHRQAAAEMRAFLDALGVDKCMLWGHSDGAVASVIMGLEEPERFPRIIVEAIHYDRCKARSRGFFETAVANPRKFGPKVAEVLAREHGEDYWEKLLRVHGGAWLDILDNCHDPAQDFFGNRISNLKAPLLILHGSEDPRTEPGELKDLHRAVPHATMHVIERAGHSPHTEPEFSEESTRVADAFLRC